MFPEDEQPEPLFKQHLIQGYETCHEMAQGVPEDYLKMKGQMYEKMGRQKLYFECANVIINILNLSHYLSARRAMRFKKRLLFFFSILLVIFSGNPLRANLRPS